MEKARTANTYASCGRNDPARKRWLNRIPFAGSLIQRAWRRKSSFIMEIATGFDELSLCCRTIASCGMCSK